MTDEKLAKVREEVFALIVEISDDDVIYDEPDIDLFDEGLFDSMAAIEFLVRCEENLGVSIATTEVEREEMNTPNKIVDRIFERMEQEVGVQVVGEQNIGVCDVFATFDVCTAMALD